MMHVSYTELRAHLAKYMEQVCDARAPLLVTRQNARGVVMISEEEFEGMLETLHLLRNPANSARLLRSIEEAGSGKVVEHDPTEIEGAVMHENRLDRRRMGRLSPLANG